MTKYFRYLDKISIFTIVVTVLGFLYFQSNQTFAQDNKAPVAKQSSPATTQVATVQDQAQENDQRCENKKKLPEGQKPDPNKIDCDCHPKCPDGKRQESTDCKKHCKPDFCDCPDPCPKT